MTVILADAQKNQSWKVKEMDKIKSLQRIRTRSEFFAFYRAMQAYEKALIGGETSLILSPDSEFFKFLEI